MSNSLENKAALGFEDLSLSERSLKALSGLGFKIPTPIQYKCIPKLLEACDLVGQSPTGSGKTVAFVLPLLEKIDLKNRTIQGLILCPTRELCLQVASDIKKLGRPYEGLQVLPIIGGVPGREQAKAIANGVHIVVATPGRLADHITREQIDLTSTFYVVLDEADKMLDMGFEKEVQFVFASLPKKRQTVFFSASFPEPIQQLSQTYQIQPIRIEIEAVADSKLQIEEIIYECPPLKERSELVKTKLNYLMTVLRRHSSSSTIIFCNQKITVNEIYAALIENSVSCAILSGDLEQRDRDRVITLFRNGSIRILVATDVAARGLDIDHIGLVVNFDLPHPPEIYLHRIGRTGRAGRAGVAVSLMIPGEERKIEAIESFTGNTIRRQNLASLKTADIDSQDLNLNSSANLQNANQETVQNAKMQTLHISGGKKDKLRPGDILGALTGPPSPIGAAQIGKIDIQERFSFVAIASGSVDQALLKLNSNRIKGKKFQVKKVEV